SVPFGVAKVTYTWPPPGAIVTDVAPLRLCPWPSFGNTDCTKITPVPAVLRAWTNSWGFDPFAKVRYTKRPSGLTARPVRAWVEGVGRIVEPKASAPVEASRV